MQTKTKKRKAQLIQRITWTLDHVGIRNEDLRPWRLGCPRHQPTDHDTWIELGAFVLESLEQQHARCGCRRCRRRRQRRRRFVLFTDGRPRRGPCWSESQWRRWAHARRRRARTRLRTRRLYSNEPRRPREQPHGQVATRPLPVHRSCAVAQVCTGRRCRLDSLQRAVGAGSFVEHARTRARTLTIYTLPPIRPTWHRGGGLFEADSAGVGGGAGPIPYDSTPQGKPHSRSQGPGEETSRSEGRGEGRGQEQDGEELTLLRSQLQAVQNIRRELDKKDIEVNSLRQENNTLRLGTTAR